MRTSDGPNALTFMDDEGTEYEGRLEAAMPAPADGSEQWVCSEEGSEAHEVSFAGRWHACPESTAAH